MRRSLAPLALLCLLAAPAAGGGKNPVEPLSNGLALTMTGPEIKKKFGAPTEKTFDARTFGYPGFSVNTGGRRQEIWHLTLKKGVKLSSGIGAGSSRSDVEKVFGSADEATAGPYKLTFTYAGDAVSKIKIDPANGSFAEAQGAPPAAAAAPASGDGLVGTWDGVGSTLGRIDLAADGTYSSPNGGKGTWKATRDGAVFTGPLAAWNGGRARLSHLSRETLEFQWTGKNGKQYFAFGKF
ncbi:MAG: hypothetical protein PHS14_06970 [Elusimicrobia bacterium]|nr:hypothetical protein [Elusimicrobiota bacterium]